MRVVCVGGRLPADDLDQRHHRHRVHEVHADHLVGPVRRRGELRDRDRGGVRGQDGLGRRSASSSRKSAALTSRFSTTASTTRSRAGGRVQVGRGRDARERRVAVDRRSACPSRPACRGCCSMLPRARSRIGCVEVAQHDVVAGCANTWAMPLPMVPAPSDRDHGAIVVTTPSSTASATPLPPPRHSVAMPRFLPRSASAWSSVVSTRAPLAPIGWPSATAPPFTLTLRRIQPELARHRDAPARRRPRSARRGRRSPALQPVFSQSFRTASHRRHHHQRRLEARRPPGPTMRASGFRPSACARLGRGHDERRRAVVHARRVAGRHRAALLERRLQLAPAPPATCPRAATRPPRTSAGSPFFCGIAHGQDLVLELARP